MIYIIGCGGVGSWLAEAMVRLVKKENLILVDGDVLEEKNLDRQLFTPEMIGRNKADALAGKLDCESRPEWYAHNTIAHRGADWLMCCVDNSPARREVLTACDLHGCSGIFAANEVTSSEAYLYLPQFRDKVDADPRKYYPEMMADNSNNPAARSIGCTGVAQENNRQLVTANFMAAALAAHLYVVWALESRKLKSESMKHLPTRLFQNLTKSGSVFANR